MNPIEDKRVANLLRGATQIERFIVSALTAGMDEEQLDELFDGIQPRRPSYRERVAGRPVTHWFGKTEAEIAAEVASNGGSKSDVASVIEALGLHGHQIGAKPKEQAKPEPTFGKAKHPLSYFADKTDEQILDEPGIGEAALKDIRDLLNKPAA